MDPLVDISLSAPRAIIYTLIYTLVPKKNPYPSKRLYTLLQSVISLNYIECLL